MSTIAPPRPTSGNSRLPSIDSGTCGQMQSLTRRIQALLPAEQTHGHVVGVTSCSRQEGVSVIAGNLAIFAAELYRGRVLLVDANPQDPSIASRFGVGQATGLNDCLTGELALQECIVGTAHSNLFVLPAGSGLLRSPRCSDKHATTLFDNLRRDFELIIVDFPQAGEIDEVFLASRLVDGFLLVVESERIRKRVAQRVVRELERIDARILGAVLNKRKNHIPEWLYRRL